MGVSHAAPLRPPLQKNAAEAKDSEAAPAHKIGSIWPWLLNPNIQISNFNLKY